MKVSCKTNFWKRRKTMKKTAYGQKKGLGICSSAKPGRVLKPLVSKPSSLRSDIETEREAQGGWQCQPCWCSREGRDKVQLLAGHTRPSMRPPKPHSQGGFSLVTSTGWDQAVVCMHLYYPTHNAVIMSLRMWLGRRAEMSLKSWNISRILDICHFTT